MAVVRGRLSRLSRPWRLGLLGPVALALTVGGLLLVPRPASAHDGHDAHGVYGAPSAADGWTETKWGPLGPADRDLLVKVRWAGLWEMPAGDQAQRRAVNPAIRQIGAKISAEHHDLDEATREVAAKLGVALPNEPNSAQRDWLSEMYNATGEEFDRIFINRLRAAHGSVFSVIAFVRAGTRNELIRQFAATGNEYVMRHMGYLESSGLVDWATLPAPPDPYNPPEVIRVAGLGTRGIDPIVIWAVLGTAAIAGLIATLRVLRAR